MTTSTDSPPTPAIEVLSRHVRRLHRASFAAAQGHQPTQLHFIDVYARYLLADGVPLDLSLRADGKLRTQAKQQRLPAGHMEIADSALKRAQFAFWWETMWDVLLAVYDGTPDHLPSRSDLDERMRECGGTPDMQSFSSEEMVALARTFSLYRRASSGHEPEEAINKYLAPAVIRVEHGFQGASPRYPARPRTDGGDVHGSRLLERCQLSLRHYKAGTPDLVDRIYREICRRLSWLTEVNAYDPAHAAYRDLIDAYNRKHSDQPVKQLHVPISQFPTG